MHLKSNVCVSELPVASRDDGDSRQESTGPSKTVRPLPSKLTPPAFGVTTAPEPASLSQEPISHISVCKTTSSLLHPRSSRQCKCIPSCAHFLDNVTTLQALEGFFKSPEERTQPATDFPPKHEELHLNRSLAHFYKILALGMC